MSEKNSSAVTGKLQSDNGIWTAIPDYLQREQEVMHKKFEDIANAVKAEGYENVIEVDAALDRTHEFTERAFELYDGRRKPDHEYYRAFTIPTHNQRGIEEYSTGNLAFTPLLDPKFGVTSEIWQRALVGFPPTILDTYTKGASPERLGALVYAPLFHDMMGDIVQDPNDATQWNTAADTLKYLLNDTADFAHRRLGSKVMGLGAILPVLSNFGNDISVEGLTTTTGHGGTVHLILETIKKLEFDYIIDSDHKRIGIIGGAGSIGFSTLDSLASNDSGVIINSYDKNNDRLKKLASSYDANINVQNDVIEVLESSDVTVAAISGTINLDDIDPSKNIDLSGKVIIDDSQPGCFDRTQVEQRGGKLIWVVGKDGSSDLFMESDTGYSFGGEDHGLYDDGVWGCQAEVAVIAASGNLAASLRERVTPTHVKDIAELCAIEGLYAAAYQSHGKPVNIK